MKNIKTAVFIASLLVGSAAVHAASHAGAPMAMPDMKKESSTSTSTSASTDMTEGEVRRVNAQTKQITLKHGDIKNLDMPGMTMVFGVKDAAMLKNIKAGDKIRFKAEKEKGEIVVTEIKPAK